MQVMCDLIEVISSASGLATFGCCKEFIGFFFLCLRKAHALHSLQITPAHDPNDFDVGKRHNLPFINIFTDDGLINSNGGKAYSGMKRFDARVAVVKELEIKVRKYALWPNNVSNSLKSL